jgi:hypothetical protein
MDLLLPHPYFHWGPEQNPRGWWDQETKESTILRDKDMTVSPKSRRLSVMVLLPPHAPIQLIPEQPTLQPIHLPLYLSSQTPPGTLTDLPTSSPHPLPSIHSVPCTQAHVSKDHITSTLSLQRLLSSFKIKKAQSSRYGFCLPLQPQHSLHKRQVPILSPS